MYLVFDTEEDIDTALNALGRFYKFQRLDGKWVTPKPGGDLASLPTHTEEAESTLWYPVDSKQYAVLKAALKEKLHTMYNDINEVYCEVKTDFTDDNILNGITQLGQTKIVADALERVDYYMRSNSVYEAFTAIDEITRVDPFLSEARLTEFKTELYTKLTERGVI